MPPFSCLLRTIFLFFLLHRVGYGQIPKKQFNISDFDPGLYSKFTANKIIPVELIPQVLVALSYYPELSQTKIIFRKRRRKTPLSSRPSFWSILKKKENRTYIITISSLSSKKLSPILYSNLPYNAQIGVLGHELTHISDYGTKKNWQLLSLFLKLIHSKNVDKFEYRTDHRCIAHGLGFQLYDWSTYVRQELHIPEWRGEPDKNYKNRITSQTQRYMNPLTIKCYMDSYDLYKNIR